MNVIEYGREFRFSCKYKDYRRDNDRAVGSINVVVHALEEQQAREILAELKYFDVKLLEVK